VSILTIDENEKGELKAERVGGTSLGGGFFLGLANLLVGENNFHKLLEMAEKGNFKYTDITP
jgi:type II pantothenate kinase